MLQRRVANHFGTAAFLDRSVLTCNSFNDCSYQLPRLNGSNFFSNPSEHSRLKRVVHRLLRNFHRQDLVDRMQT